MRFLEQLRRFVGQTITPELAILGFSTEKMKELSNAAEEEAARTPRIATVGETGVGKSSTINALFDRGLAVSHTQACTQVEQEIAVEKGERLRVVDMPGLGEDVESDERHVEAYRRVLPGVDVVLWVVKADNRAMTHIQTSLARLTREGILDPARLVVALNQVDLLQPGCWDANINQPSAEQEETIGRRREDVAQKIRAVLPALPQEQIVAYSATKFYNLELLLEALLRACDKRRRWVIFDRANCADFNQLIPARTQASPET